jgi:hypothetical protein
MAAVDLATGEDGLPALNLQVADSGEVPKVSPECIYRYARRLARDAAGGAIPGPDADLQELSSNILTEASSAAGLLGDSSVDQLSLGCLALAVPAAFGLGADQQYSTLVPDWLDRQGAEALEWYCVSRLHRPRLGRAVRLAYNPTQQVASEWQYCMRAAERCLDRRLVGASLACLAQLQDLSHTAEDSLSICRRKVRALAWSGLYEEALDTVAAAIEEHGDSPHTGQLVWSQIALLLAEGQDDAALELSLRAQEDPRYEAYARFFMLGEWYGHCHQGRQEQARSIAERLTAGWPDWELVAPVMLWQGYDHLARQNYAEVREVLTEVVRRFPDTQEAAQANEMLSKLQAAGL